MAKQLPMNFNRPAPFVSSSPTSAQAAVDIVPFLQRLERVVYTTISRREHLGATDDEVEAMTGLRHQTASARRRALVIRGYVKDSGQTRATRSGRRAVVWVVSGVVTPLEEAAK